MSSAMPPVPWRQPLLQLALLWLLVLVAYRDTAWSIVEVWERSNSYAHGWFVPPITLWLMWRRREQVWARAARPSWSALVLPLGAALLWLAGAVMGVNAAMQFGLAAMLVGVVPLVIGWHATRPWAFALGFLFLAVPFGDFMLPTLMSWTADFTVLALQWTGIPVYREGLHFIIPSGSWSVAEACSGIRYLVASVMAGCLYGYLYYRSLKLRLKFLALAVGIALVANWLRAYIIVLLGHYSGNTIATGVDHLIYGWMFFLVVLVFLFWLGGRWEDPPLASPALPEAPVMATGQAGVATSAGALGWFALAVALTVVLASPLGLPVLRHSVATQQAHLATWQPVAGWQAKAPAQPWSPAYVHAQDTQHTAWQGPGQPEVGVHLHYFRQQDGERKMVSSVQVLVGEEDERWVPVSSGTRAARWGDQAVLLRETLLRNTERGNLTAEARRLRVWQLYWVDGQLTSSAVRAKLYGALQLLRGRGDDGALVTLYTDESPQAGDALAAFLQAQGASMGEALRKTQGRD